MIVTHNGICFDDVVEGDYTRGLSDWTQVCEMHKDLISKTCGLPVFPETITGGGYICGVQNCTDVASYYIGFPIKRDIEEHEGLRVGTWVRNKDRESIYYNQIGVVAVLDEVDDAVGIRVDYNEDDVEYCLRNEIEIVGKDDLIDPVNILLRLPGVASSSNTDTSVSKVQEKLITYMESLTGETCQNTEISNLMSFFLVDKLIGLMEDLY